MGTIKNLLAGFGGAIALNVIHESLRHLSDDTPRIDLLGEEALQKGLKKFATPIKDKNLLYAATVTGDLISNTMYFSLIGTGNSDKIWHRAVTMGLAAGAGAVVLPKHMGLNPKPVTQNNKIKALTVAYYLTGALVTAGILHSLKEEHVMSSD